MDPQDKRHGSNAGYRAGCRQDCCRVAHAAYRRSVWRKRYTRGVDRLYVDTLGTRRRINALQALGWRLDDIAAAVGSGARGGKVASVKHTLSHFDDRIHVDTAATIAEVYERLSMTLGPSEVLRQRARKWGWAPPLAWEDIDDPDAIPHGTHKPRLPTSMNIVDEYDEAVVLRVLAGDYRLTATAAEKREVIRRWKGSHNDLGRLTGWRIERYLDRDGDAA